MGSDPRSRGGATARWTPGRQGEDAAAVLVLHGPGRGGDLAEARQRVAEQIAHQPVAVVAALVHGARERQEAPHQVERLRRVPWCHAVDDRPAVRVEVLDHGPPTVPVDVAPRPPHLPQPAAHRAGHLARALPCSKLEPQAPLRGRVALAELDHQLGQARSTQGLEVRGVQRGLRSHDVSTRERRVIVGRLDVGRLGAGGAAVRGASKTACSRRPAAPPSRSAA